MQTQEIIVMGRSAVRRRTANIAVVEGAGRGPRFAAGCAIVAFSICFPSLGWAQQGVMDRDRPDYDPLGVRLGAFMLLPSLTTEANFDSNVYRTEQDTESDYFFRFSPAARLQSQWSNHRLDLHARLDRYQYSDLESENRTDWDVGANGRFDIRRGIDVSGAASYDVRHEPRRSPDEPGNAASPTRYNNSHADLAFSYRPYRVGLSVGAIFDHFDYGDTELIGGGVRDNASRERDVYSVYGRGAVEFSPGYGGFVQVSYNERAYKTPVDFAGFNRDSEGYRVDAGLELLVTDLIKGDVFVGYMRQDYAAPLGDVAGLNYGAGLEWYATPLITVHFDASRSLNETTLSGAATRDDRRVNLAADYELRRNLILQGTIGYTDSQFRGIEREDAYVEAGFNATYLINRNLKARAGYTYDDRSSSVTGASYADHIVSIALTVQF